MAPNTPHPMPEFFRVLIQSGILSPEDVSAAGDVFYAASKSLSQILAQRGITTFPNDQDQMRSCDKFYDDWYLYALPGQEKSVYGLFKMREQEQDAHGDEPADGDTPGVTISFISFDTEILNTCLLCPTPDNRKALNREINRVVAQQGQTHDPAMKAYFSSPKAEGPYLIARLYVRFLAGFAQNGSIPVPRHYAKLYQKYLPGKASRKESRLPRFLEENNTAAGYTVCDHRNIYILDPAQLSVYEQRAILATHTANATIHSFAAEVCYHARFLTWFARIPLPVLGRSIYASAIRADMTIDDGEFEGPAPFYRLDSRWVTEQKRYHADAESKTI